ncbi:MAG: hypothetical protein JO255_10410, partial [Alphaproteobacteria bacterium]|nr:hypothetical protein [Alphaproteobacteria bacterium]
MARDYLRVDRGRYSFRRRVPSEIAHLLGKGELVKTIGHCNHREACRRARRLTVASDKLFMAIESNPHLSRADVEDLVRSWFRDAVDEEERLIAALDFDDPAEREREVQRARDRTEGAEDLLRRNDWEAAATTAEEVLREAGLSMPKGSPAYRELCRLLLRGNVEVTRLREARLDG